MLNVPSTSPIPLLYGEGKAARTRNGGNPTDFGGSTFVQFQAGVNNTTTAKSSQLYVNSAVTSTPLTGNGSPYGIQPNSIGSSLLSTPGALAYSGNWNTSPFIGSQLVNGFPEGGFPGTVIRGKFYGIYTIIGTPVMNFEVGVIQNNAGASYPYTALSAMSAYTWATLPSAQPWEANFEIVVNNNLTTTSTAGSGFTATMNTNAAGSITAVNVTNAGSGYIGIPTLAVTGLGVPTTNLGAILIPVLNGAGGISQVLIASGGAGYTASQTAAGTLPATATAGSVYARGNLIVGGVAGAPATVFEFTPASTTLDTTQPYWIDIRSTFSTNGAGLLMQTTGGYLEFLN